MFPCPSVLIRGRFYLLAAEQCWRSGRVVYVVFLTNHNPHFSLDGLDFSRTARRSSITPFPCTSVQFSGLPIPLSARCVVASGGVPDEPRGRMGCFAMCC